MITEPTDNDRRVYYQNIVYAVCNILDSIDRKKPGTGLGCGTVGSPSRQVQERMATLAREIHTLRALVLPAETLVELMDSVPVDPHLGDETDRVFPRWEFDDLRAALGDAVAAGSSTGMLCDVCGIGFYLPSGACDYCNQPRLSM